MSLRYRAWHRVAILDAEAHEFTNGRGGRSVTDNIHSDQHAFRNLQRRLSCFVRLIPDLDLRALLSQETYNRGNMLVGGAVHHSVAILVDGIDVTTTTFQYQLHGFHNFGFRAGLFERRIG